VHAYSIDFTENVSMNFRIVTLHTVAASICINDRKHKFDWWDVLPYRSRKIAERWYATRRSRWSGGLHIGAQMQALLRDTSHSKFNDLWEIESVYQIDFEKQTPLWFWPWWPCCRFLWMNNLNKLIYLLYIVFICCTVISANLSAALDICSKEFC
jgi:hypothetical protein